MGNVVCTPVCKLHGIETTHLLFGVMQHGNSNPYFGVLMCRAMCLMMMKGMMTHWMMAMMAPHTDTLSFVVYCIQTDIIH